MIQNNVIIGISEEDEIASEELIDLMKIISEAHRFKIIQLLLCNTCITVSDLSCFLQVSQPAISQHLKVLTLSSIVKHYKSGRYVYYSIDHQGIENRYGNGLHFCRHFLFDGSR